MSAAWRTTCVMLLAACGGANAGQSHPQACAPVEPAENSIAEDSTMDASRMGGDFVVRLVASSGPKRGATIEGRFQLMPHDSAHRRLELADGSSSSTYTLPLYGTAAIDLAAVGAVAPGDPGSPDPASPGVLVIQSPGSVMLRLGADANRRGVRRYDGAFTVLRVQRVTEDGFAGTWQSGVGLDQSAGHFCADRAAG